MTVIDKEVMKAKFEESAKETNFTFDMMERILGRYQLYRFLFNYPKKWSKRKVKKKGSKDIQYLKLDYGIRKFIYDAKQISPEYNEELTKQFGVSDYEDIHEKWRQGTDKTS